MPGTGREGELRYALDQLEQWLQRWKAGHRMTSRERWNVHFAVQQLKADEGARQDPRAVAKAESAIDPMKRIDPELPDEPDAAAAPRIDYSLEQFERDLMQLREKFAYLGSLSAGDG
ncbi:hypothetical protein KXS07_16845 [Inquilinus limosus]|uniref:hypothetical protein n=1 Tax=Inquilinus limosus TaxID=171674 RepID=UPI003F1600D8